MVLNKKLVSIVSATITTIFGRGGRMMVSLVQSETDATARSEMVEKLIAQVRVVYAFERSEIVAEWRKHNPANLAKWEKAEADAISRWESMKAGFANMDASLPWSARKAARDAAKLKVFAHSNSICALKMLEVLTPSRNFEQEVEDCLSWEASKAAATPAERTGTEG